MLLFAAILEQINVAKRGVGASRTPRIHQRFCSHRGRPSLPPCEVYELLPNLLEKNTTLTYLSADYCRLYFRLIAYILLNTTARERVACPQWDCLLTRLTLHLPFWMDAFLSMYLRSLYFVINRYVFFFDEGE